MFEDDNLIMHLLKLSDEYGTIKITDIESSRGYADVFSWGDAYRKVALVGPVNLVIRAVALPKKERTWSFAEIEDDSCRTRYVVLDTGGFEVFRCKRQDDAERIVTAHNASVSA